MLTQNKIVLEKEVYLDNAATTKPLPEVVETVHKYLTDEWYNPSSKYPPALQVKRDIEQARKTIADFIGAKPEEIYFTSGASEANCLAIKGYLERNRGLSLNLVTSKLEHKSILELLHHLINTSIYFLSTKQSTGEIKFDENTLSQMKLKKRSLVSVQYANNEIGTIQDMDLISRGCRENGFIFHTDATQAFPHIKFDMSKNNIDMMSVSGHKFGAPKGIGFLYVRKGFELAPLICGTQENGMRGGTENVPYIMGMAKAVEMMNPANECPLADYFEKNLVTALGCRINGGSNKLKHIISCTFPEYVVGDYLIHRLAEDGIYLSAGSACNSYSDTPSTVLDAIGLTHSEIARTIRISLSNEIKKEDIDYVLEKMNLICSQLKL